MKRVKILIFISVFAVLATYMPVFGAVPPSSTPEIQNLQTIITVKAEGMTTETEALAWRLSSELLDTNMEKAANLPIEDPEGLWVYDGPPGDLDPAFFRLRTDGDDFPFYFTFPYWPEYAPFAQVPLYSNEPPLNDKEIQMAAGYDENTNAVNGITTYIKSSSIQTGTQTLGNYNVKGDKTVTFRALAGGKMISEENMMIDTVGKSVTVVNAETGEVLTVMCPFSPACIGNCTPAFSNIIQSGSRADIYVGSLRTNTESRSVGKDSGLDYWPPLPIVDGPPVELNYEIYLTGLTPDNHAEGSAMAYMKAHLMEGARECPSGFVGAGEEITYSGVTSGHGSISLFHKTMNYQSGMRLPS